MSEKNDTDGKNIPSGATMGRDLFPMVIKPVGDPKLARWVSRLGRPWDAPKGGVYAIERRVEVAGRDDIRSCPDEIGYWRRSISGRGGMSVSLFDLASDEVERVAPVLACSFEDNRHEELLRQHIKYHHETRSRNEEIWPDRLYVCLLFWGGMLVIEESLFEDFLPADQLVPDVEGGFGFGFLWRELTREAIPNAHHDADILLGKYVADRLYPGLPEPIPTGRGFGVSARLVESIRF